MLPWTLLPNKKLQKNNLKMSVLQNALLKKLGVLPLIPEH
jgi:hypothetical protein